MISRSLGIETGGAVGIPLYLAQGLSVALHTVGFAESVVGAGPQRPGSGWRSSHSNPNSSPPPADGPCRPRSSGRRSGPSGPTVRETNGRPIGLPESDR